MQQKIKEHERDIRLVRTQTSAVSEHTHETGLYPIWNAVKFIEIIHFIIASTTMNNNNLFLDRFSTVQISVQYRCIFVLLFGRYSLQLDNKISYCVIMQTCIERSNSYVQKIANKDQY